MRPAGLLHLYRVRLRARAMQELLAVAGIAVGVALMFASLVANTSLTGSLVKLDHGLMGDARFQITARGPTGMPERIVGDVARIDGVTGMSTVLESAANVIGPDGRRAVRLFSGTASLMHFGGPLVRRLVVQLGVRQAAHTRALAVPAPLAAELGAGVGQTVRLQVASHTLTVPVFLQLQRSDYGDVVDNPIVITSLAFLQRVSDMRGRLSRIFVLTRAGRDAEVLAALKRVAKGAKVTGVDHEAAAFARASYPVTRSSSLFSAFAAFIGFLFAFSAVLLTVPQRRRFIADLRMAGHEPWVTLELLLFDALVLGAVGSLIGLLGGYLAVRNLIEIVPQLLTYAFPLGEHVSVSLRDTAMAAAAGLAAAAFAVLVPLRDVLPRRGSRAGSGSDGFGLGLGGVAIGFCTLALSTALVVLAPQVGPLAFAALTASVMLFLPALLQLATAVFEALTRAMRTPVPTLAALELRSRSTRTRAIALASTAALAVLGTVTLAGSKADLQRGLGTAADAVDRNGDVWATFPGANNALAIAPFPVGLRTIAALRAIPDVERVAIYRSTFIDIGDRRALVQAPPRSAPEIAPSGLQRGDRATATRRLRKGGWVVLSTGIADALGVGLGARVTLPTPVPTALRVAAISTNGGWPPGMIVLNADDYARAWGTSMPNALQIGVAPGASPARVKTAVRRAMPAGLPVQIETSGERIASHHATSLESLARLDQITALVLGSAVLAIVGVMASMIWQRRPAIAQLKVHGYPEGELWRALLLESALLLGTGCLIGAAFGLYGQVLLTRGMQALTDFPARYVPAGVTALELVLLLTAVAVTMIALPGWFAVRVRPAPGGGI